jgi:hypothetical protein
VTSEQFVNDVAAIESEAISEGEPDEGVEERQSLLADSSPTRVRVEENQPVGQTDDVAVLSGPPVLRPIESSPPQSDAQIPEEVTRIVEQAREQLENPDTAETSDVVASTPIDAVVGHVNGRPLFASEFFEPMDARLRQEATRLSTQEWLRFAQELIAESLRDRIRDELLLAELEASMSAQERQGLLSFVNRIRENLVSQRGGAAAVANRKILEEEGITLNEKVLRARDQELVRFQLRNALEGKTFVPWREVEQQYERDRDRYDVPPVARFHVIWSGDDETSRLITTRLLTGEQFTDVAIDGALNSYPTQEQLPLGVYEVPLENGELSGTRLFGPDVLNDASLGLRPGEHVGPVDWVAGPRTIQVWIYLESIEDRAVDLYQAQLAIYDNLFSQRLNEAQAEYFIELINRGSLSNIDQMQQRLFRIAAERYLIAGNAQAN